MKSYFERLVESVSHDYSDDLPVYAFSLLNKALECDNRSMHEFRAMSDSPYADNDEMKQICWKRIFELDAECKGLLRAYKALTDREVTQTKYAIIDECGYLLDTFPGIRFCQIGEFIIGHEND